MHHLIILKNFTPKDGTISFSMLSELSEKPTTLAKSAVLSLVEGNSRPGQGKRPEGWEKGSAIPGRSRGVGYRRLMESVCGSIYI